MSECQDRRECQIPVASPVFGQDPCPETSKYIIVSYKCKPGETPVFVLQWYFVTEQVIYICITCTQIIKNVGSDGLKRLQLIRRRLIRMNFNLIESNGEIVWSVGTK